eukprot:gb/GECG01011128.1/.p1 GENE.gb/GECG01011128.1/~~gb/GECG01011128.1/.p1  ORF type:complete len:366 (+),score=42.49 gb/GECG01011128.1/:1-1098(+)
MRVRDQMLKLTNQPMTLHGTARVQGEQQDCEEVWDESANTDSSEEDRANEPEEESQQCILRNRYCAQRAYATVREIIPSISQMQSRRERNAESASRKPRGRGRPPGPARHYARPPKTRGKRGRPSHSTRRSGRRGRGENTSSYFATMGRAPIRRNTGRGEPERRNSNTGVSADTDDTSDDEAKQRTTSELSSAAAIQTERRGSSGTASIDGKPRKSNRHKGTTSVFGTQNRHTQTTFAASISSDIDDTSDDDEDDEGSTTSELSSAAAGQTERSGSRGTPRFDGRRRKSNIQKATTSLSGTQTRRTQTTSTTGTTSERRMGTSRVSSERVVRIRSAVTDRPTEATETTIANGRMLYRKRNSPSAT